LPSADPQSPIELLNAEQAALGFYFSGHPLDDYVKELKRLKAKTYVEAIEAGRRAKSVVKVAIVVRGVRMRRSRKGNPFAWVECSDVTGEFEITVFSEVLEHSRDILEVGALLLASISAEEYEGDVRLTCEGLRRLDAAAAQTTSQLRVSVTSKDALAAVKRRLLSVKPATRQEAGDIIVLLQLPEWGGREVELAISETVACTPAMRGALKSVDGVLDVELV